jgi:hypothetical protein
MKTTRQWNLSIAAGLLATVSYSTVIFAAECTRDQQAECQMPVYAVSPETGKLEFQMQTFPCGGMHHCLKATNTPYNPKIGPPVNLPAPVLVPSPIVIQAPEIVPDSPPDAAPYVSPADAPPPPPPRADCSLPGGGTIHDGEGSYSWNVANGAPGSGNRCGDNLSWSRCNNGVYTIGGGQYASCTDSPPDTPAAGDCNLPWGGYIHDGQRIESWLAPTPEAYGVGAKCWNIMDFPVCHNGILNGVFPYGSCTDSPPDSPPPAPSPAPAPAPTPAPAPACELPWGGTIPGGGGGRAIGWAVASAPSAGYARCYDAWGSVKCVDGVLSNPGEVQFDSCTDAPPPDASAPGDCELPWGGSIHNGENVLSWLAPYPGYKGTYPPPFNCWSLGVAPSTCDNGVLPWSIQSYGSCSDSPPAP